MKINYSKDIHKLKKRASKYSDKADYQKYILTLELIGLIHYQNNDVYHDDYIDSAVKDIARKMPLVCNKGTDLGTLLFYDGFGLERRGLAAIYLKALVKNGYRIIYITNESQKDSITYLRNIILKNDLNEIHCIKPTNRIEFIKCLVDIYNSCCPRNSFFYSFPYDIVGPVFFDLLKGKTTRFQINLTDHAYWNGIQSIDYSIEFRDYGASVTHKYRKLAKDKIIKLPFYPEIDNSLQFEGYPFEYNDQFVIFSGGALYKTFGDNDKYYRTVSDILQVNNTTVFWYAGFGDTSKLLLLKKKFPGRVFITEERRDLYQILKHCHLYLNTYPVCGGLMTQYASVSGVIPLTLLYDECGTGFLLNSSVANNEFYDAAFFHKEVYRLINNVNYRNSRTHDLRNQVINEDQFAEELYSIIETKKSNFNISFFDIDTERFRNLYKDSVNRSDYYRLFVSKKRFFLISLFFVNVISFFLYEIHARVLRFIK